MRIEAFYDGQKLDDSTVSCEVGDESLARYDAATGKIIVNSDGLTGETTLFVSAKYGEYLATTPVTISVSCPIADYTDLIDTARIPVPSTKSGKTYSETDIKLQPLIRAMRYSPSIAKKGFLTD